MAITEIAPDNEILETCDLYWGSGSYVEAYDSFNLHIAKEAVAFMGKCPEAKETEDEYQIFGNVHFIKR